MPMYKCNIHTQTNEISITFVCSTLGNLANSTTFFPNLKTKQVSLPSFSFLSKATKSYPRKKKLWLTIVQDYGQTSRRNIEHDHHDNIIWKRKKRGRKRKRRGKEEKKKKYNERSLRLLGDCKGERLFLVEILDVLVSVPPHHETRISSDDDKTVFWYDGKFSNSFNFFSTRICRSTFTLLRNRFHFSTKKRSRIRQKSSRNLFNLYSLEVQTNII